MANQNTKVFFCMETENTQNQHPLPWTGLANSLGAPFLDFGPNNSFLSTVLLTVITVALRFSGVKYTKEETRYRAKTPGNLNLQEVRHVSGQWGK